MAADPQGTDLVARRRPKDRKAQIVAAAARMFSARGYHTVGLDEIAAEVGISGPALYRHFTNKYALFVAAADYAAQTLVAAAQGADDPRWPAVQRLSAVTGSLIETVIEGRRAGALYRWERRYLEPADRGRIWGRYAALNAAVADPLADFRPGLSPSDIGMLAAAVLSTIGSITAHRTRLPATRLSSLLTQLCWSILNVDLPPASHGLAAQPRRPEPMSPSKRERLLVSAIRVFGRQGFSESSIEEIGRAAGMNASSVYRYYPSKAELLSAALGRAADRVHLLISDALAESVDPRQAATRIAERYAAVSFADPELINIYFAEFGNLPAHNQENLRTAVRNNISEWAHLVEQVRPGPTEARFRVHAALALVVDIGRSVNFDVRPGQLARVSALMTTVLFDGEQKPT